MDSFSIIQNFFTRMRCNQCQEHLRPEGIRLMREEGGVFVVNVSCKLCDHHVGVAMVGLDKSEQSEEARIEARRKKFPDPELTPQELERLAAYDIIDYDDVLSAHEFFSNLGDDWLKHVPVGMRQLETAENTESQSA